MLRGATLSALSLTGPSAAAAAIITGVLVSSTNGQEKIGKQKRLEPRPQARLTTRARWSQQDAERFAGCSLAGIPKAP